jgi:hypothetical protein
MSELRLFNHNILNLVHGWTKKWSPLSTNVNKFVHPYPRSNCPCLGMWSNLSTFIEVAITLIHECNWISVILTNDQPCSKMQLNFSCFNKQSPLSKSATEIIHPYPSSNWPYQRSVTEFWSLQQIITPIQKCNRNCPPLSK